MTDSKGSRSERYRSELGRGEVRSLVADRHLEAPRTEHPRDGRATQGNGGGGILRVVKPDAEILAAAQLDAMTPDERRAEFERRLVRDVSELPDDLRERIRSTAEQLARVRAER